MVIKSSKDIYSAGYAVMQYSTGLTNEQYWRYKDKDYRQNFEDGETEYIACGDLLIKVVKADKLKGVSHAT